MNREFESLAKLIFYFRLVVVSIALPPLSPVFTIFSLPFYVSLLPFIDLLLPPFTTFPAAARHFAFCFNCTHKAEAEKGQGRGTAGCAAPVIGLLVVVGVFVVDKLATDSVLCRHK